MSQLDRCLPEPRLRELDHVDVAVPIARAYEVVRHLDLSRSWLVRTLFELRTAPSRLGRNGDSKPLMLRLDDIPVVGEGFHVLCDAPEEEFVVGAIGRFWEPDIPFADVPAESFAAFDQPGFGKLAWSLRFEPISEQATRIFVEVRVTATDEISWRIFRLYFGVIGPFSRLIRHHLMSLVERELGPIAERPSLVVRARHAGEGMVGALGMAVDALTPFLREARAHWGLTKAEAARTYPGDERIPTPRWGWTHAIEIAAPAERVWPWIAQMGQDRAGFYSFQALENLAGCRVHDADAIHPEWQRLQVGDAFRLHPDMPPMHVLAVDPGRSYVVGADDPHVRVTWLFLVEPFDAHRCRFVSRYRVTHGASPRDRLAWGPTILEPVGFEMDRRMLLGVKERAERGAAHA
jgi:hypothetical protein